MDLSRHSPVDAAASPEASPDRTLVGDDRATGQLAHGPGEPLPVYLKEIGRVPLLAGRDQVRLAQRIEQARAATEHLAAAGDQLPRHEREELAALAADGRAARDQLAAANLRLVVSIARRYSNRGVPLPDLIQEGNLGLLRAVEKFDWRRGFKFSTYATWWIRQAVARAVADDARTIRIPVHLFDVVNRITRTAAQLHQELGREPTSDEVAAALQLPPERVGELLRILPPPISLDGCVGAEQETPLSELIADESGPTLEQAAEHGLLADHVRRALLTLTPRERHVIERRFGLRGEKEATLTSIGGEIGVTRERIRQIEASALRKLRHPSRAKRLRTFAL